MFITREARSAFHTALSMRGYRAVRFTTKPSVSGKKLGISFANPGQSEELMDMHGLPVLMDDQTSEWTKLIFIDARDGRLFLTELENDGCGGDCGSCGGC